MVSVVFIAFATIHLYFAINGRQGHRVNHGSKERVRLEMYALQMSFLVLPRPFCRPSSVRDRGTAMFTMHC
jgi:hypothetical protein